VILITKCTVKRNHPIYLFPCGFLKLSIKRGLFWCNNLVDMDLTNWYYTQIQERNLNLKTLQEPFVTGFSIRIKVGGRNVEVGGGRGYSCRIHNLAGGSGGMLPLDTFKICASKSAFPAFWSKN